MRIQGSCLAVLLLCLGVGIQGCAKYSTPGGPADFRALGISADEANAMTDASIAAVIDRKPAASFPASVAVVRLQDRNYSSYTVSNAYDVGKYSVVTIRDVEEETDFDSLSSLPHLRGIAPLNRLVVPNHVASVKDLRLAAARVQADFLLIYTFDTQFGTEKKVPALGTITLGVFPSQQARVTSTASAAFLDTRTGFIYGLAEATESADRMTNAWNSKEAVDKTRRAAERKAWESLVGELQRTWVDIASTFGPPSIQAASTTP